MTLIFKLLQKANFKAALADSIHVSHLGFRTVDTNLFNPRISKLGLKDLKTRSTNYKVKGHRLCLRPFFFFFNKCFHLFIMRI